MKGLSVVELKNSLHRLRIEVIKVDNERSDMSPAQLIGKIHYKISKHCQTLWLDKLYIKILLTDIIRLFDFN